MFASVNFHRYNMTDVAEEKVTAFIGATVRRLWLMVVVSFTAMLIIVSIDESSINNLNQIWKYNPSPFHPLPLKVNEQENESNYVWVTTELSKNYTNNLISHWMQPGGKPCLDSPTENIKIPEFQHMTNITLTTTIPHIIILQALDSEGNPRCMGGDFFEINLSSENWKSRPPLTDLGNGNYSFTLQVHQDFQGDYTLTISLLFRHFEGLKFSPTRFVVDKQLQKFHITFANTDTTTLPPLPACEGGVHFNRTLWAGRWTRVTRNDSCVISPDGRYRCQPERLPCPENWCSGPLGLLESNGWVYSAHCGFKLFTKTETWDCLSGKWLLWWGDSNHVDTVRNIAFFFLGITDVGIVTRRFDKTFTNPTNTSQTVRITNIFNGHWDDKGNYEGLNSLSDHEYREMIKGYFSGEKVPDTVVFNSGLHDGVKWMNVRRFAGAAEMAAGFWEEAMRPVREEGKVKRTQFVFRSTVATGGYARTLAFNPNKMEAFNGVLLEKLIHKGIVDAVVDDFDMTWAWHFDNRCNDGVHYGRFPAKLVWRDGQIGHQYFVDLMLGHVLLNVICLTS